MTIKININLARAIAATGLAAALIILAVHGDPLAIVKLHLW